MDQDSCAVELPYVS